MQPVTMFETEDGRVFASEGAALGYEGLAARCRAVELAHLGPRPKFTGTCQWAGPYQLSAVAACADALSEITRDVLPESATHPGRMEAEGVVIFLGHWNDPTLVPLAKSWARLTCIDADGKEWDQYYHAHHPESRSNATRADEGLRRIRALSGSEQENPQPPKGNQV